jgi:hypothetical protein
MARAYKLPNAASTIAEIEAAQEVLNDLQTRARELAASIGKGVVARFRRRSLTSDTNQVVFGLDVESTVLAEGWRYVKTRDAVEPVRGAKGDDARKALAALEAPAAQPGSIIEATGMPMVFMYPGRIYNTQWMHHDGALYALLPDEDTEFRNDPIEGDWVQVPLSELYAADEARLAGSQPVGANA